MHHKTYDFLPDICSKMLQFKTANSLKIFNRNEECFYDSTINEEHPLKIFSAINQARESALTKSQLYEIYAGWNSVFDMMKQRNADEKTKEEAQFYFAEFTRASGICFDASLQQTQVITKHQTPNLPFEQQKENS